MMAGRLDRSITIQRSTTSIDAGGTPSSTWADVAMVRAQLVKASTEEFYRAAGAIDETAIVFRTWWMDDVTVEDRVVYDGIVHDIKELKEIGRRNGLEIRTFSTGEEV